MTLESTGSSFTSALSLSSSLAIGSSATGLTVGKTTNTANITVPVSLSIAGPVAIYGGQIDVQQSLTSAGAITLKSSTSDVLLSGAVTNNAGTATSLTVEAARHIRLGSNASITASTSAMSTQLWSDTDASGDGIVYVESSGITTRGGALTFGKSGQTATIGGQSAMVGGDVFFQRGSTQTLSTGGGAVNVYGEVIVSNTNGLVVDSGNGNVTFHGILNSGNSYSFINKTTDTNRTWDWARTDAKNSTAGGSATGESYLVNITSRLENAIAGLTANYNGAWIGAYRSNTNSYAWVWADGPEANAQFFTQGGSTSAGYYANFGPGEPNGGLDATRTNVESVGQFYGAAGRWNDLNHTTTFSASQVSDYAVLGYVRETNLGGSPVTIQAGTGTVNLKANVGSSKAISTLAVTAASTVTNGTSLVTSGAQNYTGNLTANVGSSDLLVKGSAINVSGVSTITAGRIYQQANLNATGTGAMTLNGALIVNADNLSITSGIGGVNFSSTINSDASTTLRNLTVTATGGDITLGGAVGTTTKIDSLLFNANNVVLPNANTTLAVAEDLVFNAALKHAGTANITATLTAGDDIYFNGAISAASTGKLNLALTGAKYSGVIAFEGDVTTAGGSLTATAETISFQATSNQTIDTSISGATGGAITLSNTGGTDTQVLLGVLNSGSAGALTVNSGGGAVSVTGTVNAATSIQRQTAIGLGLTGWSSAATYNTGYEEWGTILGPFSSGSNSVTKALDFGSTGKNITFDVFQLESWDTENFRFYVGATTIGEKSLVTASGISAATTATSVVSGYAITLSPSGGVLWGDYGTGRPDVTWTSQKINVSITTPALSAFTFKVDSSLNSTWNDEGWGIKNLLVRDLATAYSGNMALTVNAGAGAIGLSGGVGQTKSLGAVQLNSTSTTTLGGSVTATSVNTNAGGTLQINGASVNTTGVQTFGENINLGRSVVLAASDISTGGAINLGSYGLTLNANADYAIAGVVSGASGSITKQGTGALTLSGDNTFTGGVTVSAGTVKAGASAVPSTSGAMGTGAVTVQSGAVVDLNGKTVANALNISGTGIGSTGVLINSSATAATASGAVTVATNSTLGGTGAMTLSGVVSASSNTVTFANASGFTATNTSNSIQNIVITNSALTLKTNQALSVAASSLSGATTLQTVAADKDITIAGAITNTLNGNSLTLMAAKDIAFSSSVSGASGKSLSVYAYSDTDNSNAGGIRFSSFISTWGGHVVLGGGTTDTTSGCAATFSCTTGYASQGVSNIGIYLTGASQ
ncbi:hypothetical protein B9Z45_14735 [Limnohabitans sp. 2KL-17]|uniref:beta strand repeat-containing protein n=1 Tax=Limnohabitans sp. 2KL-17 TaxID=1100704 RepID=UPI000D3C3BE9|nr:autotransporter-associated beta strand repeat-containing protein [Limnohabitans sp. 2KL-17]PUE51436.1 hypothetical protein B9Z45_14735 [Limnohabitans sp. 2KL-17]